MRITGLARIELGPDEAKVLTPIWARDLIKAMPNRRWSPDHRAWVVPTTDVPELRRRLERHGYIVRTLNLITGDRPPLVLRKDPA